MSYESRNFGNIQILCCWVTKSLCSHIMMPVSMVKWITALLAALFWMCDLQNLNDQAPLLMPCLGLEPLWQWFMPRPGHRCQNKARQWCHWLHPHQIPQRQSGKAAGGTSEGRWMTGVRPLVQFSAAQIRLALGCPHQQLGSVPSGSWWAAFQEDL